MQLNSYSQTSVSESLRYRTFWLMNAKNPEANTLVFECFSEPKRPT